MRWKHCANIQNNSRDLWRRFLFNSDFLFYSTEMKKKKKKKKKEKKKNGETSTLTQLAHGHFYFVFIGNSFHTEYVLSFGIKPGLCSFPHIRSYREYWILWLCQGLPFQFKLFLVALKGRHENKKVLALKTLNVKDSRTLDIDIVFFYLTFTFTCLPRAKVWNSNCIKRW